MKIKSLMFVLMGTMLVATSCSDTELENGKEGSGTVDPVKTSGLVSVYADKSGSEASLLAGDVLVKDTRALTLNVPAACEKVYMKYNTVSGKEVMKEFALSPVSRSGDAQTADFAYETSRMASVTLALPEDAVKPTDETDEGYLFYHNTGVAMFEDGWPQQSSWYDEDFNDVVFEYDLKVTECQDAEKMALQGSKEELLLTLDVRAVGGMLPTKLGVVLEGLNKDYVKQITAKLLLKGGQGTMKDLGKEELSETSPVVVNVQKWKWDNDNTDANRFAILTVDKEKPEGTVITLDGLSRMKNDNNWFQVTWGAIRVGLPMLRAEIRLIGEDGLTGDARKAQLAAYRELILNTYRQNFFITNSNGKEIHMKGYAPTSSYETAYAEDAKYTGTKPGEKIDANVSYSNENGYTWGIKVPVGIQHAYETVSFKTAYPKFENWVAKNGKEDKEWYLHPNPASDDKEKETAILVRYW